MAKFLELDAVDKVVSDHVFDVVEPVRHVTISLPTLQNDLVPTAVERVDYEEHDAEPLNHIPNLVDDPQGQKDEVELSLKRFTRQKRSAISNNYVVFIGKGDYDISHVVVPMTFHNAVSSPQADMWLDSMKDEMGPMAQNEIYELVELFEGFRLIGCK